MSCLRLVMSRQARHWVKDIIFEFEDGITLYDFVKQLENKHEEITRELGVGINRAITVSIEDLYEPKLVLSVYKSEGGF